jgi:hypothetical protein
VALAFRRKYIDLPVELCTRIKVAAAEKAQSERAWIAEACDRHLAEQEKATKRAKPAKSSVTVQQRKRK